MFFVAEEVALSSGEVQKLWKPAVLQWVQTCCEQWGALGFSPCPHPCPHPSRSIRHLSKVVPTSLYCGARLNSKSFAELVVKRLEKSPRALVSGSCNRQ